MPFCNQNGILGLYSPNGTLEAIIPFWLQKCMKMKSFAPTNSYVDSMRRELSKSGLGMLIRPLVMILCYFLCLSKIAKKEGGGPKKKRHKLKKSPQNHFFGLSAGFLKGKNELWKIC